MYINNYKLNWNFRKPCSEATRMKNYAEEQKCTSTTTIVTEIIENCDPKPQDMQKGRNAHSHSGFT